MTSHCANWGLNSRQIIIERLICKETVFIGVAGCRETVLLGQTPRVINALMTSLFSISFPVAVRDTLIKSNLIEEKMIIAYYSGLQPTIVEIISHITFKVKNQQYVQI